MDGADSFMEEPYYILENGLPKKVDYKAWFEWAKTDPDRDIKRDYLFGGQVKVITVFFLIPEIDFDALLEGRKEVYLYGTMVFGGAMHEHEEKYKSLEAAEDAHARILAKVKAVQAGTEEPYDCCKARKVR